MGKKTLFLTLSLPARLSSGGGGWGLGQDLAAEIQH